MNEKSWNKIFSRVGWGMTAFFAVSYFVMIVISAALTVAGIYSISADGQLIMNGISMYVIGFPVAYLIFKSTPYPSPERRTEKWTGWTWCGVFLICQGIMYGGNLLGLLFMAVFGSESSVNVVQEIVLESNFLLNFLLVVVAGPIVEELLTRKLIIDRILLYGEKTAIFVSALLFGLLHGNFYQFFYAFGIGLILGYAYVRTGKITGVIGLHMAVNFAGSEVALLLIEWAAQPGISGIIGAGMTVLYGCVEFGAAIGGIVLLCCFWKKRRFYQTPYEWSAPPLSIGRRIRTVAGNPGILIFTALCLLEFALNF